MDIYAYNSIFFIGTKNLDLISLNLAFFRIHPITTRFLWDQWLFYTYRKKRKRKSKLFFEKSFFFLTYILL